MIGPELQVILAELPIRRLEIEFRVFPRLLLERTKETTHRNQAETQSSKVCSRFIIQQIGRGNIFNMICKHATHTVLDKL